MAAKQTHEMEGSADECRRKLTQVLGHYECETVDDRIVVRDGSKHVTIDLASEPHRNLGSLDLPMTRVEFAFDGFTDAEVDQFMLQLESHMAPGGA